MLLYSLEEYSTIAISFHSPTTNSIDYFSAVLTGGGGEEDFLFQVEDDVAPASVGVQHRADERTRLER